MPSFQESIKFIKNDHIWAMSLTDFYLLTSGKHAQWFPKAPRERGKEKDMLTRYMAGVGRGQECWNLWTQEREFSLAAHHLDIPKH